ncbi:ComEC/Rec2 family competence protein [Mesorhizobium sp. L-8-3]|uniref:ComEC/Rec2 family competence protein n=1 Tax=Mesorhizobium sp. L-8-3 TaxID=2744522 RepID=UPI0019279C91|nr:ComEC/Rec2 family competence protein [Mesorhizobium sp. L-8-3]
MSEGRAGEIAGETSLFAMRPAARDHPGGAPADPVEENDRGGISARPPGAIRRRLPSGLRLPELGTAIGEALVTEWERGTAFLFIPVFLAAGAIAYYSIETEPGLSSLAGGVAILCAASLLARTRPLLQLAVAALLLILLGMLFGSVETRRAGTRVLGSEISTVLTGRVAAIEHQANGRVRLTLDVLDTARPKLRYAPERVRVSARAVPADLVAGSVVTGVARLFPPSGPLRPGSYDFSFESFFDGIGANGFFLKDPEVTTSVSAPVPLEARFHAVVENARTALAQRIRGRIGGPEGEIAAALIAGTRAGIPEEVNEALRRTGLAHVLSISGLHMALVAVTIMTALRLGFALFPGFASRRPVKKYAAVVALAATAVYLFISGSAVAAERSFIMLAVMLLAVMVDRAALTMRNLAIAAIAVIALSPHEVVGPSFQMSFAATAALIGAYGWWAERRASRPATAPPADASIVMRLARGVTRNLAGLVMVSMIAGLATSVYGVYHFQRVSPLSIVANLAAMPIVSVIVMPCAVVAMAAMPFGLDGIFLDTMGRGLAVMVSVADWFSDRSPLDAVGTVPVAAVVSITAALVIATLASTWLRALSLPFVVAGLALVATRSSPDVLVSEDARLVGMPLQDGRLAVNRSRPNGFTVEDWQRATGTAALAKPSRTGSGAAAPEGAKAGRTQEGASGPVGVSPARLLRHGDLPVTVGFLCGGGLCLGRQAPDVFVAHAETAEAALAACGFAALIVIDDATAENPCPHDSSLVITKRHLARQGTAQISLSGERPIVRFTLAEPYRPWHAHRQFSREARGLPPFRPKARKSAVTMPD